MPLLRWSGRRAFTVGHSLEHVLALGATGSGKTSASIKGIALAMLHAGYGVLFLTAKVYGDNFLELAKQAGRGNSRVRFSPPDTGWAATCWNMSWVGKFQRTNHERAGQAFTDVGEIKARNREASDGDGKFWVEAAEMMMRYAVNAVVLATGKVELDDVVQVFLTAPKTPEQVADPNWTAGLTCHKMLVRAKHLHGGDNTVKMTEKYFYKNGRTTRRMPEVREQSPAEMIINLCQSEPLHRLFFSKTDFTPEILKEGAVLIVDAPALKQGVQGRVINGMMRLAVERMMQNRNDSQPESSGGDHLG